MFEKLHLTFIVSSNSVEVPETTTGLNDEQIEDVMRQIPEDITMSNATDIYVNVLHRTLAYNL